MRDVGFAGLLVGVWWVLMLVESVGCGPIPGDYYYPEASLSSLSSMSPLISISSLSSVSSFSSMPSLPSVSVTSGIIGSVTVPVTVPTTKPTPSAAMTTTMITTTTTTTAGTTMTTNTQKPQTKTTTTQRALKPTYAFTPAPPSRPEITKIPSTFVDLAELWSEETHKAFKVPRSCSKNKLHQYIWKPKTWICALKKLWGLTAAIIDEHIIVGETNVFSPHPFMYSLRRGDSVLSLVGRMQMNTKAEGIGNLAREVRDGKKKEAGLFKEWDKFHKPISGGLLGKILAERSPEGVAAANDFYAGKLSEKAAGKKVHQVNMRAKKMMEEGRKVVKELEKLRKKARKWKKKEQALLVEKEKEYKEKWEWLMSLSEEDIKAILLNKKPMPTPKGVSDEVKKAYKHVKVETGKLDDAVKKGKITKEEHIKMYQKILDELNKKLEKLEYVEVTVGKEGVKAPKTG